jgi:UDP-N-acetylmuramoyl-tripeptide--D-alanyl-D-alanine ligase
VLNADNHWFDLLNAAAKAAGATVRTFGTGEGCDARPDRLPGPGDPRGGAGALHGKGLDFPILQTGLHWGMNSMAGAADAGGASDVDLGDSLAALGSFEPLAGRGRREAGRKGAGAFTLIDESYNANPISMASAIATLGKRGHGWPPHRGADRHAGMGPEEARFHADWPPDRGCVDRPSSFCAGPLMKSLWDALRRLAAAVTPRQRRISRRRSSGRRARRPGDGEGLERIEGGAVAAALSASTPAGRRADVLLAL